MQISLNDLKYLKKSENSWNQATVFFGSVKYLKETTHMTKIEILMGVIRKTLTSKHR